eukprot:CAMPEP_0119544152 /NCGR_PEP_ID=MMETSP1344-20130328/54560_1 /TAXON_ID=236787 /ORGANISM="Florenciella parvula, Strain CCMP2471" /LENGTH=88 /DNA_ID=CAMNT_0007588605 /DNA_START=331 /DNA_END=595 /DNA_ORIENTATION=-
MTPAHTVKVSGVESLYFQDQPFFCTESLARTANETSDITMATAPSKNAVHPASSPEVAPSRQSDLETRGAWQVRCLGAAEGSGLGEAE